MFSMCERKVLAQNGHKSPRHMLQGVQHLKVQGFPQSALRNASKSNCKNTSSTCIRATLRHSSDKRRTSNCAWCWRWKWATAGDYWLSLREALTWLHCKCTEELRHRVFLGALRLTYDVTLPLVSYGTAHCEDTITICAGQTDTIRYDNDWARCVLCCSGVNITSQMCADVSQKAQLSWVLQWCVAHPTALLNTVNFSSLVTTYVNEVHG